MVKLDPTDSVDIWLRGLRPQVHRVLSHYRIPAQDAEDLVQEALISTIQKWDQLLDPEDWLLTLLRKRCLVYWRKRRALLYDAVDTAILELLSASESESQEHAELLADLNTLLDRLPLRCQTLLRLRYGLEIDPPKAARNVGKSPSRIRKASRRCMAALTHQMVTRGSTRE